MQQIHVFVFFLRELPLFITLLSFSCDLHSSLNLSQQQTLSVFFFVMSLLFPMSGWCKGVIESLGMAASAPQAVAEGRACLLCRRAG